MKKLKLQLRLEQVLKITKEEWNILCSYGYTDRFYMFDDVASWQQGQLEAIMEEEQIEMELGEPLWEGNDKNVIIDIMYRQY